MSLCFAFDSTMLSGIRKFCDHHFIGQLLFKCIVDVLADGFIVPPKQRCQLLTCQPYHIAIHFNLKLNGIVLVSIDYNLVLFHFL